METNADKKERENRKFRNILQYVEYPKEVFLFLPAQMALLKEDQRALGTKKKGNYIYLENSF